MGAATPVNVSINNSNLSHLIVSNEGNWNGRDVQQSTTTKNFNLVTAFTFWASEKISNDQKNNDCNKAAFEHHFEDRLPATLDEVDRLFITRNLRDFNGPWAGFMKMSETQIDARLKALQDQDVVKEIFNDAEFKTEWSFFAMTEVPGTSPMTHVKLQWLKNGELHFCTIDACSKAPKVLVMKDDGDVEIYDSVPLAVQSQIGTKRVPLAILLDRDALAQVAEKAQKAATVIIDKREDAPVRLAEAPTEPVVKAAVEVKEKEKIVAVRLADAPLEPVEKAVEEVKEKEKVAPVRLAEAPLEPVEKVAVEVKDKEEKREKFPPVCPGFIPDELTDVYAVFGEKDDAGEDEAEAIDSESDNEYTVLDFRRDRRRAEKAEDEADEVNETSVNDESVAAVSDSEAEAEEEKEEEVKAALIVLPAGMRLRSGTIYYPEQARTLKYRHFKIPPRYPLSATCK